MIGARKSPVNTNTGNCKITLPIISKTVKNDASVISRGITVETHCRITGFVADGLLKCMPSGIKDFLFPKGSSFLAAIHDIGKISPAFQKMIHSSIEKLDDTAHPELQGVSAGWAERSAKAFHGAVTQAVCCSLLDKNNGNSLIATIEGMHHGFKPCEPEASDCQIYGGSLWDEKRQELFRELKEEFFSERKLVPDVHSWEQACVLGGFITVCDWIASGGVFADLTLASQISDDELQKMAAEAVKNAGFYKGLIVKPELSFKDIFGFEPRPIQSDLFETVTEPGVYILEAPMGSGKTEAALYASYKMLAAGKASGIYFGLPTQLTSNKIHERVQWFLERITGDSKTVLSLLHSSAWLEKKTLGEDGDVGQSWFDSAKRGILAPFAVGTVDQALMACMNVKHAMVRAFGLAGKIVILDEVHSYDSYTGTILAALVKMLRKIDCTVIILSATLTAEQKRVLLSLDKKSRLKQSYPLISASHGTNIYGITEKECENAQSNDVEIICEKDEEHAIDCVLEKAERGEQILWIENTVSEAQNIYKKISARLDEPDKVDIGLIHSRFIKTERNYNEAYWVSLYGKNGTTERSKKGRILVGTQVLEQSLDIDSDFLVTRLCPSDMLLQRMGRLWRHESNNSQRKTAKCQMMILAPDYNEAVANENSFGLSSFVYSEYVLLRTLKIWEAKKTVKLPADIRSVLEETYEEHNESGRLQKLKDELTGKKEKLQMMANIGLSSSWNTMRESTVQTRYSEIENVSVLILTSFSQTDDGCTIQFADNPAAPPLAIPKTCKNKNERRRIAKLLMEHTVAVSASNAPQADSMIDLFSEYVFTGKKKNCSVADEKDSPFRVAIVGRDDYLRTLKNTVVLRDLKRFLYNTQLGYQVVDNQVVDKA